MTTRHLDLGCGMVPRNPYRRDEVWGVDINPQAVGSLETVRFANLSIEKIPFDNEFFDSVSAYDFLEHVPRVITSATGSTRFPFVELMNEVWRVLPAGGKFYAVTPGYPRPEAFTDPTHVNTVTRWTHTYFALPHCGASPYGFTGCFRVVRVKWIRPKYEYEPHRLTLPQRFRKVRDFVQRQNSHLLWELEAVKR